MPLNRLPDYISSNISLTGVSADYLDGVTSNSFSSSLRGNRAITGGGTITFDVSGNLFWSTRFIIISNGRGPTYSLDGYYDMYCPTSGTITGVGGAANRTATGSGIQIGVWEALYAILPVGLPATSATYRVVSYFSDVEIPHDWVLIAVRNGDNGYLYLNNGTVLALGESSLSSLETYSPTANTVAKRTAAGALNAASFVRTSGTASQFLKADGSVDSSTYISSSSPTITTPVIDSISASAATGINPSLYSNTTTGNISIGSGLTSGQMNIATGGSSATPISIGHTNATIGLTGNTTVTGTLTSTSTIQGTTGTFTGSTLAINGATPAITSTNTSAASIFTSTVSGVTIGSSTIKTTAYPLAPIGTTSGTVTQSAQLSGYLGMPQNPYVAAGIWAYGIGSLDAGKHIYVTGTPTSATITIPANSSMAFEIGTTIVVMNDLGAATNISIAITTDTLQLAGTGATGTRTLARYGVASMTKVTSTKWIISGNGLT